MGKQHDEPNTTSYKSQSDSQTDQVPSNIQGREVPGQSAHGDDVNDNAHDKKKAQNALHEGLKPAEGGISAPEVGAQGANT
ncbi:hypothetical protein IAU60_003884 [Kwoniella sp. DSM 27419]